MTRDHQASRWGENASLAASAPVDSLAPSATFGWSSYSGCATPTEPETAFAPSLQEKRVAALTPPLPVRRVLDLPSFYATAIKDAQQKLELQGRQSHKSRKTTLARNLGSEARNLCEARAKSSAMMAPDVEHGLGEPIAISGLGGTAVDIQVYDDGDDTCRRMWTSPQCLQQATVPVEENSTSPEMAISVVNSLQDALPASRRNTAMLQARRVGLVEELAAARSHLRSQQHARRVTVDEHLHVGGEVKELELEASFANNEVEVCRSRLAAFDDSNGVVANEEALASLECKNHLLESRFCEAIVHAARFRGYCESARSQTRMEMLELQTKANQELRTLAEGLEEHEEEMTVQERSRSSLHSAYGRTSSELQAEISSTEEARCQANAKVTRWREEEAAKQVLSVRERSKLMADLEELRLLAADAACRRGRARRLARVSEVQYAESVSVLRSSELSLQQLVDDGKRAEQRLTAAEAELELLRGQKIWWEKQLNRHRQSRQQSLDCGEVPWREHKAGPTDQVSLLQEEFHELQRARWEVSQVEERSHAAQEGLVHAVVQLLVQLREEGHNC